MKKRVTGLLLALCLCLTLLPGTAFAAYAPMEVSQVSVSVTAPTAGSDLTESTPAVANSQPYFVDSSSWTRVAAEGCTANVDSWGSRSEKFENNNWYLLCVKLLLDYGYAYAESVTATGLTAEKIEVTRSGDDSVFVYAWFKVGSPADAANIDSISVSNVPTTHTGNVGDWTDAMEKATISENCKISYATIYAWDSEKDCWSVCYHSDSVDSGKVYGAGLVINTTQGHTFTDSTAVTVNGETAEITEHRADEMEIFVPFGTVTIDSVEVDSGTWPIEGNTINKSADNFSIDAEYMGCTLASAQFQVWDSNGYRDLSENETVFRKANGGYRVIAVLKAKSYAAFAASVTGDFNGTSGVNCEISEDGTTCTMTRTCEVYDPIYTYKVDDATKRTNGVDIYRPDPTAGGKRVLGEFAPTAGQVKLAGAEANVGWYEVPYVGSTTQIKRMGENDTFEEGKVYLSTLSLSYLNANDWEKNNGIAGYRFGEGFTVSFKQLDGSDSNYARMECTRDTAKSKQYNIWYTVGNVTQQAVTNVTIIGPEPENGTIETSDLSEFTATGGVTITSASYNYNRLSFTLKPQSSYYFGRTVTVTYNDKVANVSDSGISDLRFDVKYASVDYTAAPATSITVSGITTKDKTYDGTKAAELTGGTLNGVKTGDDVQLDFSDAKAEFDSKDVGSDKTVSIKGTLKLKGTDAGKYILTQPTELNLTADITSCTAIKDATNKTQTIYVGENSFEAPKFTGVTVGGKAEKVTGSVAYTLNGKSKTAEEIGTALKALKAGEKLEIGYTFTTAKDGNYSGTAKGTITVTAKNRPAPGTSSSVRYDVTVAKADHGTVSANAARAAAGDTVTLTVQPDSGYVLTALTVTDSQGREVKLTDLGGGKYTFTMPDSRVEVKAAFAGIAFSDVPSGAYYAEAVRWAVEKGVTNGTGDGTFQPNGSCTRAQLAAFLWRLAGEPESTQDLTFTDVRTDAWCAKALRWAAEQGIVTGYADGSFRPDQTVTRIQAVAMLYRYAKAQGMDTTQGGMAVREFDDFAAVPAYGQEAAGWAVNAGILQGANNRLMPNDPCTRAQIVTFLYRATRGK